MRRSAANFIGNSDLIRKFWIVACASDDHRTEHCRSHQNCLVALAAVFAALFAPAKTHDKTVKQAAEIAGKHRTILIVIAYCGARFRPREPPSGTGTR